MTDNSKSKAGKWLDDIEHILLRPNMYIGNTNTVNKRTWIISEDELSNDEISINDGLNKIIMEVIDNAIDEFIKTKGKFGNKLEVNANFESMKDLSITIEDNGRGVSHELVKGLPFSVIAFTKLKAGGNFDDDNRTTKGLHGVGVSLTNVFSNYFGVDTDNGEKLTQIECSKNMKTIKHEILKSKGKRGTTVSFKPDLTRFKGVTNKTIEDIEGYLVLRLSEIASFYKIKVFYNGKKISKFFELIQKYNFNIQTVDDFHVGLAVKEDDLDDFSYVNGIYNSEGGIHYDVVSKYILNIIRDHVTAKYKLELRPSFFKKYVQFFLALNEFESPVFDSQTKNKLVNSEAEVKDYLEGYWEFIDEYVNEFIDNNADFFDNIVRDINSESEAKEIEKLKKQLKKQTVNDIKGFIRIEGKHTKGEGSLFITEGDSASGKGLEVRDIEKHAFYSLTGKIVNVYELRELDLRKNRVIQELMLILGLDLKDKDISNLNYKDIYIFTDGDVDGSHISMLLIIFFAKFFPDIIKKGKLKRILCPIIIASQKDKKECFYSIDDFNKVAHKYKDWKINYYKGLGEYPDDIYSEFVNKPNCEVISLDATDEKYLEKIMRSIDFKKKWLQSESLTSISL
jgi:DNA gyrase/topoisomerase IV subunit B